MHHILIKGMTGLSGQDEVLMTCALMCTVTCWTRPMVNHDIKLSCSHDFTKPLHYIVFQS